MIKVNQKRLTKLFNELGIPRHLRKTRRAAIIIQFSSRLKSKIAELDTRIELLINSHNCAPCKWDKCRTCGLDLDRDLDFVGSCNEYIIKGIIE